MRKVRLRKWVIIALITISFIAAVIASGECENIAMDYISKIVAITIIVLNGTLLIKYGDLDRD